MDPSLILPITITLLFFGIVWWMWLTDRQLKRLEKFCLDQLELDKAIAEYIKSLEEKS